MEHTSEEKIESTQKTLQSFHDPGWNDPPKWAYTPAPNSANPPSTKRLLNKRVAFPLNSSATQSTIPAAQPLTSNLPPLPSDLINRTSAPHAPLLAPTTVSDSSSSGELAEVNTEQSLKECLVNLKSVINDELQNHNKLSEVEKRLDSLELMWKDGKFNSEMHRNLLELSKALASRDIESAEKIHVTLMMNYPALCSSWISGIRHLIIELQEKYRKDGNVTSENPTSPFVNFNQSQISNNNNNSN